MWLCWFALGFSADQVCPTGPTWGEGAPAVVAAHFEVVAALYTQRQFPFQPTNNSEQGGTPLFPAFLTLFPAFFGIPFLYP